MVVRGRKVCALPYIFKYVQAMKRYLVILILSFMVACGKDDTGNDTVKPRNAYVESLSVNGRVIGVGGRASGIRPDSVVITVTFSSDIDVQKFADDGIYMNGGIRSDFTIVDSDLRTLVLKVNPTLDYFETYALYISEGENLGINIIDSYKYYIVTSLDESPKFEEISDDELLTMVQQRTFSYFWDYAHPESGLARERLGSGNTVTTGGSGFGIMSIPVAVEREFITRSQGAERVEKIVTFLLEKADRFHGAFPHWLDGQSGKTQPFSQKDNGADLVETAFLIQGLLTVGQYFDSSDSVEVSLRAKIQTIWEEVEWSWFTRQSDALYWHWSPDYQWDMNMKISGWNEALIVYVLAAASPTYPITRQVYDNGWAGGGSMANGKKFYDVTLPLGSDYGGPLFFSHYSFLGLDPRGLSDSYADYWEQNTAHATINYLYCKANPKGWYGYSENCWGLTASDIPDGYTASSPTNDVGTIAPTAALSSFPYTPEQSMAALRYFYYVLGDKLWDQYGFKDAFNLNSKWFATSYLAIDQGPIVVMIENYRTALLWEYFMRNQDVRAGLEKLGFSYASNSENGNE